jgi:hypothetical protein
MLHEAWRQRDPSVASIETLRLLAHWLVGYQKRDLTANSRITSMSVLLDAEGLIGGRRETGVTESLAAHQRNDQRGHQQHAQRQP